MYMCCIVKAYKFVVCMHSFVCLLVCVAFVNALLLYAVKTVDNNTIAILVPQFCAAILQVVVVACTFCTETSATVPNMCVVERVIYQVTL